jgi:hypothetical protein
MISQTVEGGDAKDQSRAMDTLFGIISNLNLTGAPLLSRDGMTSVEALTTYLQSCVSTDGHRSDEISLSSVGSSGYSYSQPRASTSYNPHTANEAKAMLQEEVKRISTAYTEEGGKLELSMKVEQARQRQALQRKLLDRKQVKQTSATSSMLMKDSGLDIFDAGNKSSKKISLAPPGVTVNTDRDVANRGLGTKNFQRM